MNLGPIAHPLVLVSLLLTSAQLAIGLHSGSTLPNVIDQGTYDAQSVVQALCHDQTKSRISQPSTISLLADFLETQPDASELFECRKQYLEPLLRLQEVVNQHNDDICSFEKINLLTEFHFDYVISSLSKKWRKVSDKTFCPEPLRVFFMHYASEISNKCREALPRRLQSVAQTEDAITFSDKLGNIAKAFWAISVPTGRMKNFDDFALLWDMILKEERKKGNKYNQRDALGELVILDIKMQSAKEVWSIQRRCRHQLRPVYQNTILPVMKLIDLGYNNQLSKDEIGSDNLMREWYSIVQACEMILPISIYEDAALGPYEAQIMDSKAGSQHFFGIDDSVATQDIPSKNPSPAIKFESDILTSSLTKTDRSLVKLVKANMKNRGNYLKRVWRNITANLKGKLRDKLRNLFVFKNSKGKKVVAEGSINDSIKKTERFMEEPEDEPTKLVRPRRYAPSGDRGELGEESESRFFKIIGYSFLALVLLSWIVAIVMAFLPVG